MLQHVSISFRSSSGSSYIPDKSSVGTRIAQ